jgi:hypothetical protein
LPTATSTTGDAAAITTATTDDDADSDADDRRRPTTPIGDVDSKTSQSTSLSALPVVDVAVGVVVDVAFEIAVVGRRLRSSRRRNKRCIRCRRSRSSSPVVVVGRRRCRPASSHSVSTSASAVLDVDRQGLSRRLRSALQSSVVGVVGRRSLRRRRRHTRRSRRLSTSPFVGVDGRRRR